MWIVTMYDLPTDSKAAKDAYLKFFHLLKYDGFQRMQYSVYMRPCASEENAAVHTKRIRENLPPDGEVRILVFTDKQFAKMKVFHGKKRAPTEKAPEQMSFL